MSKRKNGNTDDLLLESEAMLLEEAMKIEDEPAPAPLAEEPPAAKLKEAPATEEPVASIVEIAADAPAEPSNTGAKYQRMLHEKPVAFRKYFRGKGVKY
jgi:hypothetical protein